MRTAFGSLLAVLSVIVSSGCALQASTAPIEYLDETTAATVGALKDPIELVPELPSVGVFHGTGQRISFAYLGPVEWDKAGQYSYGLWVHVAGGTAWTAADIRSPSAVTLVLDDNSEALVPMDAPQFGREAYQPIATWGQTSYFELSVKLLQRMAASQKLNLNVQGADGRPITFVPSGNTRAILTEFIRARALTVD